MTPNSTGNIQSEDLPEAAGVARDDVAAAINSPNSPASPRALPAQSLATVRRGCWIDIVLFVILTAIAFGLFYPHAVGDLYSDEADYALASTKGFEANRWDRSDDPKEPNKLIAGRHFHAPLTVDLIAFVHKFGAADHTIRMPFLIAGALSVGMVYLCGLALFERRREIAVACSLLVAISPAVVRMSTHALPWSPIILELLVLLWCLLEYSLGRGKGWIIGTLVALAALFVTSEMFFVAAPAVIVAAPALLWPALSSRLDRRRLLVTIALGVALFLAIAVVMWPSGLKGDCVAMLRHYMQMRHTESFPVNVGSRIFIVAPKWAYLYWYWNDYKPFFLCYAVAIPGLIMLAERRALHIGLIPLLSLTALLLFAAHRAHIIGPEYLAHCLPFLTLLGGTAVYAVSKLWRPLATVALVLLAIPVLHWSPRVPLPGMDARAQVSRWPGAAAYLSKQWRPGDKIVVGSQPVSVAHWYLVYQGRVPPLDSQFQTMPVHAPRPAFLDRLRAGFYRYAGVSNMFEDQVDLDPKTRSILRGWTLIWRSDEHGSGPSRLTIYRAPDGLPVSSSKNPPHVNKP
jgi:4-amino-4-deoxy-L-arabinose transferase-like glycosyltransferase